MVRLKMSGLAAARRAAALSSAAITTSRPDS
jgi:hypothetical protein